MIKTETKILPDTGEVRTKTQIDGSPQDILDEMVYMIAALIEDVAKSIGIDAKDPQYLFEVAKNTHTALSEDRLSHEYREPDYNYEDDFYSKFDHIEPLEF